MSSTPQSARRNHWPAALIELANARLATRFWPTVTLALLALTPGLINFTALDVAQPTIGESLGVSSAEAAWATLLGNAAVPLGLLAGSSLIGVVPLRRLGLTGIGLQVLGALCSGLALNLPMLILAHTVQGFACGLVIGAVVLSLVEASTSARLPVTVTVLGIGLFGAVTLGPLIGGFVEQAAAWRGFLVFEALLALAAVVPALAVLPNASVQQQTQVRAATLLFAAFGLLALFIGIGELSWYHWTHPEVQTPMVLGAVAILGVIVAEWALGGPPATLRLAGVAKLGCVAAFAFGAILGLVLLFLQQVRGLGAQDAGVLLWPAPVAAFLGLVWVGAIFSRPRWIVGLAALGVLLLAVGAWQLTTFTEYTGDASVMQLAALLGLGVGISVAPSVLMGTLGVHKQLVGRALALTACLPYVLLAAAGPVLTYVSTVRQTVHLTNLQWQQGWKEAMAATDAAGPTLRALQTRALMLGINDAAFVVLLACVLGLGAAVVLVRVGATRTH